MPNKKVWIDTDAGVDDAHAILMALSCPDVDIVGFSTVFGNATAAQSAKNVLRVLQLVNRMEIPIYCGVEDSMVGGKGDSCYFHGKDGLGDVPESNPPDHNLIRKENAVLELIRIMNEQPGEIEVIALGPLTNLAIALRMDPALGSKIKHCHIMGGNYAGEGNVTAGAEFNFYSDPEAAHVVLRELSCPVTLSAWETCIKMGQPWELYHRSVGIGTPKATFLKSIHQHSQDNYYTDVTLYEDARNTNFELADQVTVAIALDPTIVTQSVKRRVKIELQGTDNRGLMIVDWRNRHFKDTPEINIVLDLDKTKFPEMLFGCLN